MVQSLPVDWIATTPGKQVLRSGTSVGAIYRAACRARSAAEFRSELGICEEECDETSYWIELLVEPQYVRQELVADLSQEANELLAIIVSSSTSSRGN